MTPMNRVSIFLTLTITLTGAGSASAVERLLTSVVHGGTEPQPAQVNLRAVRIDGTGSPIDRTLNVPGTESLDLPQGNWELSIQSPLFWAAPVVALGTEAVSLNLWPTASIRGTLTGEGRTRIRDIRVSFSPPEESPGGAAAPAGESTCVVDDGRWHCQVPSGTHDLRLLSTGYAAEFHWNREVQAGRELDLGKVAFRRGASLSGFVTMARGIEAGMKDVAITAQPVSLLTAGTRRAYRASVNARGFFQIAGMPSGDYRVSARTNKLQSDDRAVTIVEDRNAALRSPLVLDRPRKIVLTIHPVPEKHPWHIRLRREVPGAGRLEEAGTGIADRDGGWSEEVLPGRYLLKVERADGSVWKSVELVVEDADAHLDLSIPAVQVSGRVTLGDNPVPEARLIFGGTQTNERQTLLTDREGKFSGEIPAREDDGKKWTITIEADAAPRVQRTVDHEATRSDDGGLRFEIELPRTIVTGRVVNEDGIPERGAIVNLQSFDGQTFEQTFSEADGRFEVFGFEPGTFSIQAQRFRRSSELMKVTASATETSGIELVLRSDVIVRGRIRSRSAAGIEARLSAMPRNVPILIMPETTTDGDGRFELKLPAGTRSFDLMVQAPGFALGMGLVVIQDGKFLTITADQNGGELSMEIPVGADTVLRHDGAEFRARWLATLSRFPIESQDGWDLVRLPNVEAGEYTLCANGRCQTGFVPPNGRLALTLRPGE